jgi:hypothetical protein
LGSSLQIIVKDKMKVKDKLATIAIFTAVPADLLAIIPVIYRILIQIKLIPGEQEPLSTEINIGFRIPIRDIVLVLIFYGFVAYTYWITSKDNKMFVKEMSLGIILFLGFPSVLALTTFGTFSLADGLAISFLILVTAFYYRTRFDFYEEENSLGYKVIKVTYKEIGIWYFLWVLLVWLFLQIDQTVGAWSNFQWALLYSAIGYIASIFVVKFASFIQNNFVLDIRKDYFELKTIHNFKLEYNLSSILTIFLVIVAFYVTIGFSISSSWIVRSLWVGVPITIVGYFAYLIRTAS